MEVLHARCAGLDVHKDVIAACVRVAEGGKVRRELRTFATHTRGLLELLDWLEAESCTCVGMEATGVYWRAAWQILQGHFELILGNAAHVRNVPGRKTDMRDAEWLADLVAHGLIRASFVPPEPVQDLRDLTRTRKQLVREIVQHTNRIQKALESANLKLTGLISDVLGQGGRAILEALIAGETDPKRLAQLAPRVRAKPSQLADALRGRVREHHRFLLKLHLSQIDALREAVEDIERRLDGSLADFREAIGLLITVPGYSETLAWTVVAEIGTDMTRFPSSGHLTSWACVCPRNDESGGRRRSTRIRMGCNWLKTALIQAAWSISRMKKGYLAAQFRRIAKRRGAKKAAVAVASSLLTITYCILRDRKPYQDLGGDHFDVRNKQKTARRLVRRLKELGFDVTAQPAATVQHAT